MCSADGDLLAPEHSLRGVEGQFIEYFLSKIGPSELSEQIRGKVMDTLTKVLRNHYGKSKLS